ncbi:MAG: PKD domain-containing protein [Thermoleophilaceae bacterium]
MGGRLLALMVGATLLPVAPALASTITTVAGSGTRTDDGAPATETSLNFPIGVRATAGGFLVAEQSRYRVRKVAIADVLSADTGAVATIAGTGSSGNGQAVLDGAATSVALNLPCCLSSTAAGDLLVADTLGGMVWKVSGNRIGTVAGNGSPSSCAPTPPAEIAAKSAALCFVVGVGASPSADRFLIAEDGLPDQDRTGGARVYEVDGAGVLHIVAGGGCPNPVAAAGPLGICLVNPRGPTYTGNALSPTEFVIADRGRSVVWKISSTSPATATAAVIAGTGQATAADQGDLGDGGAAGQATLASPSDLAMTPAGGLLIADRNNCRIRRLASLSATTVIGTVAGTTCAPASAIGDGGPATLASLTYPQGVADSPQGILVSESLGGRVRLVQRTTITAGTNGIVNTAVAAFRFESSELGPSFRCALDGDSSPSPCTSPTTLTGLADGPHSFSVFDAAPPADPSPARATWIVDTTPPAPFALVAPADAATDLAPRPHFRWQATTDATTGVDHYDLVVDGATVGTLAPGACDGGVCDAAPPSDLTEAPHTWQVRAVDGAGLTRASELRTLGVSSPPAAQLTVAPNPALVGSPVTLDASASTDAGGPIARFEWDLDGDGGYELDSGTSAQLTRSFPVPGVTPVSVRVTDGVGRTDAAHTDLRISQPPTATRQYGVSIDGGAAFTNSPDVRLDLVYPESTTGVLVANDGGFLDAAGLTPGPQVSWRLASTGPERLPKTVYVRFLAGPFVSETYTDDIVLDETPPTVVSASVSMAPVAQARAATAGAVLRPILRIRARDNLSGVTSMQVSTGRRNARVPFRRYRRSIAAAASTKPVWVRVRDKAGNVSRWRRAR